MPFDALSGPFGAVLGPPCPVRPNTAQNQNAANVGRNSLFSSSKSILSRQGLLRRGFDPVCGQCVAF